MKKRLLCMFLAALFCLALCGCGEARRDGGRGDGAMDILPEVSPMISPDANDGRVTDGDGVIGNGAGADSGQTGAVPSPSTSPDTGSGMSGGQTGTNPSASPKP